MRPEPINRSNSGYYYERLMELFEAEIPDSEDKKKSSYWASYFYDVNEAGLMFDAIIDSSSQFVKTVSDEFIQIVILELESENVSMTEPDEDERYSAEDINNFMEFIREARRRGLFVPEDRGWPE